MDVNKKEDIVFFINGLEIQEIFKDKDREKEMGVIDDFIT